MADFQISLEDLKEVKATLEAIITEFENAGANSEALEAAISNPFGENKLRDEAQEFEERWNDKRSDLKDSLKSVNEYVATIIKTTEEMDHQFAIGLTPQ